MNKRRSFLRRVIRGLTVLALIALVLFAMLTLPGVWRIRRLVAERDALLAQLDRDEPGWRWDDLVPAKVPDKQNGALKVREIAKLIPEDWLRIPNEIADAQPEEFRNPRVRYTPAYLAALGQCLEKVKPARDQLPRLIGLTTGDYGWDHAADTPKGVATATAEALGVAQADRPWLVFRLLEAEFTWLLGTGQEDRTAGNLRAQIGYLRTWNRYPCISTGGFIRMRILDRLNQHLYRFLVQAEASPNALRALSRDLAALLPDLQDPWWLASEKAMLLKWLGQAEAGLFNPSPIDFTTHYPPSFRTHVDWLDKTLAKLPFSRLSNGEAILREQGALLRYFQATGGRAATLQQAIAYRDEHFDGPLGRDQSENARWFDTEVLPRWWAVKHNIDEAEERINMARVAIACELYRVSHGRWPEKYEQLTMLPDANTYLPVAPPPRGIQRVSDGIVLYWSEPKDSKNIRVLDYFDETRILHPAPDRGIRLWDPDKRKP
jgi:hypothetical protein